MPTLQQTIVTKFLSELSEKKSLDAGKIEAIRALLQDSKKAKADDLVKIFTTDVGDVA